MIIKNKQPYSVCLKIALIFFCAQMFICIGSANAGVRFITDLGKDENFKENFDNKFKCSNKYVECVSPTVGKGKSCDGKYLSCTCPTDFVKCDSPKVGNGAGCDGKYKSEDCKCPSTYKTCLYGAADNAEPCPEDGVIKWSACKNITCEDGGYNAVNDTNMNCTSTQYKELSCYDCKAATCEDGGHMSSAPSNQTCNTIAYKGKTCYKDCKGTACEDGGYLSTIPSGQTCTTIAYSDKTCYKDCKVDCKKEYNHLLGTASDGGYVYFVGQNYGYATPNGYVNGKCVKYIGNVVDVNSSTGKFGEVYTNACKNWNSKATTTPSKIDGMYSLLYYVNKYIGYATIKPNNTPSCSGSCGIANMMIAPTFGNSNNDPGALCGLYQGKYQCTDGLNGAFTWSTRVCGSSCSGSLGGHHNSKVFCTLSVDIN